MGVTDYNNKVRQSGYSYEEITGEEAVALDAIIDDPDVKPSYEQNIKTNKTSEKRALQIYADKKNGGYFNRGVGKPGDSARQIKMSVNDNPLSSNNLDLQIEHHHHPSFGGGLKDQPSLSDMIRDADIISAAGGVSLITYEKGGAIQRLYYRGVNHHQCYLK